MTNTSGIALDNIQKVMFKEAISEVELFDAMMTLKTRNVPGQMDYH